MKRFAVICLTAALICAMLPSAAFAATEFKDVPGDHWALANIQFAVEKGIVNGYPDGTFHPESPVTREEAATMLYRAIDAAGVLETTEDLSADYAEKFSQYTIAPYAQKYIAYFLKYGVINEAEIKTFTTGEAQGVTAQRVQTAVWAAKALDRDFVGAYYVPYTDKGDILTGEMPYVDMLYRNGIMKGSLQSDGTVKFLPKDGVKRCEFAAIANRVYEAFMAETAAGYGGYYDLSKETVAYRNTLDSVFMNANAEIIYNGEKVSNLSDYVGNSDIVRISSMTLGGELPLQVLVDDEVVSQNGKVVSVTALSADATRVGIEKDMQVVYYLITKDTQMKEGAIAFDFQNGEVNFIADGVRLTEIVDAE